MENVHKISSFKGGISDFQDKGIPGAFKFGKNLSIRKVTDSLSCNQALKEIGLLDDASPSLSVSPSASLSSTPSPSFSASASPTPSPSASVSPSLSISLTPSATPSRSISPSPSPSAGATSVITDLIMKFVKASDGYTYGFGDTGNIYKIDQDHFVMRIYKDSNGEIKGAEEKPSSSGKQYLYWATDKVLKRKQLFGKSDWSDTPVVGDVQVVDSNLNSSDYHTMIMIGGALHIANRDVLAFVGYDDSFSPEVLDLIPGKIAKTLIERNSRSVTGTYKEGFATKGINGAIDSEVPLIQVGDEGKIYYSDFVNTLSVKSFPGGGKVNPSGVWNNIEQVDLFDWEEGASSYVDKQSLGNLAFFGVFGATAGYNGVYSYGRINKNAPFVMNLEYNLEVDEIGAGINVNGIDLISYKDGSEYGVKATDLNNKAIGEYYGLDFHSPTKLPISRTIYKQVLIEMASLPANCSVSVFYRMNKQEDFVQALNQAGGTTENTTSSKRALFSIQAEGEIYEPKVILTPSGNNCPEVYSISTFF